VPCQIARIQITYGTHVVLLPVFISAWAKEKIFTKQTTPTRWTLSNLSFTCLPPVRRYGQSTTCSVLKSYLQAYCVQNVPRLTRSRLDAAMHIHNAFDGCTKFEPSHPWTDFRLDIPPRSRSSYFVQLKTHHIRSCIGAGPASPDVAVSRFADGDDLARL
jgi:hypothetical protein